jgi:ATP-dependent Lhr-like helicase
VNVVVRDTTEPSVLAHEILSGRPFTYLDDAPLEERRSRAVPLRRGLPVEPHELAALDPAAIERVTGQVKPEPKDADELHDVLMSLVVCRPEAAWQDWFSALVAARRAVTVEARPRAALWAAVERRPMAEALFPGAAIVPDHPCPGPPSAPDESTAVEVMLRGHLDCSGPVNVRGLAEATGVRELTLLSGLAALEAEGFALRGRFTSPDAEEEFCARRLLTRIHAYTRERRRRTVEPVNARDFMRFLLRWQHVAAGTRREGRFGVLAVVEQLQGFELATGAWEHAVLASRVEGYRREWLDELCLSGQVCWGRLSVREPADAAEGATRRAGRSPSRATPITLALRADLPWLLRAVRGELAPVLPEPGQNLEVLDALRQHGALFRHDLVALTGRPAGEIDEALWDGVARGLVTADGFRAVRSLLRRGSNQRFVAPRGLRQGARGAPTGSAGRWALLAGPVAEADRDELAEAVAEQLAARWGVVFRDLAVRENLAVSWRDVLWAFRRMEARGTMLGGRFVSGFSGEQFAHPDAVDVLKSVRKQPRSGEAVQLSAADPLNLTGVILGGPRVPGIAANQVRYVDGAIEPAAAVPA